VLVATAWLVGWPSYAKALAAALALAYAWRCRPRPTAVSLAVAADGSCRIREWGPDVWTLTDRTRITPLVLDLRLGQGARIRQLLILADQVERADWARLSALLRRASVK
jgi:hypothetical protein